MEIYDTVMIVVLVGAMIFGAIKGFAWQLASIASITISYTVAFKYREPFSQSIQAEPPWNRFLAMLILFIGTSLVIWVVFQMIRGSIDRLKLREFDRQVGAMFGLAKGALYCVLITLFGVTLMGDGVRRKIVQSKSGNYIADVLQRSDAVIPPEIQGVVRPYLERFEERFHQPVDAGGSYQSPWTAGGSESGSPSIGFNASQAGLPYQAPPPWPNQPLPGVGQGSTFGQGSGPWTVPQQTVPQQTVPQGTAPQGTVPQQAQQPFWNGLQR